MKAYYFTENKKTYPIIKGSCLECDCPDNSLIIMDVVNDNKGITRMCIKCIVCSNEVYKTVVEVCV